MKKKLNYVKWILTLFIVSIQTTDIYSDIAKDVETRFGTSSY